MFAAPEGDVYLKTLPDVFLTVGNRSLFGVGNRFADRAATKISVPVNSDKVLLAPLEMIQSGILPLTLTT